MARTIIEPKEFDYDPQQEFERLSPATGLELKIMPWILFKGKDQFDHMEYNSRSKPYPNGHFKKGTIRYSPGKIIIPLSSRLLGFESSEFAGGMPPKRIIHIHHEVICPLEELTDEEILEDGFDDRKDMLWQMTQMEGRYYPDLKPLSTISYLKFGGIGPFWGFDIDERITIYVLKKMSGYWDQLVEKDKAGWTKDFQGAGKF